MGDFYGFGPSGFIMDEWIGILKLTKKIPYLKVIRTPTAAGRTATLAGYSISIYYPQMHR